MSSPTFKDHFSGHAADYRTSRPLYPGALYAWLAHQAPARALAWDAGCGNGQASVALAAHFAQVVGTDASAAQIANAEARENVRYRVEPAETTAFADASVDLITVAQALHWFDLPRFGAEALRVAKPGAVLAAWTYALCAITPAVDAVVMQLYQDVVGPYWPPERRHTENGYAELALPFVPLPAPAFAMTATWTLPQFLAYLQTWSATQRYRAAEGRDPITVIEPALTRAWQAPDQPPEQPRLIRWPLTLRAGRLHGADGWRPGGP